MAPHRLGFCSSFAPDVLKNVSAVAITSVVLTVGLRLGLQQSPMTADPTGTDGQRSRAVTPNPADFSAEELEHLQRRFGVHGPQTQLAQLFTRGVDQLEPLRANTLSRLRTLKPMIWREADRHQINPMLITAILFDEIQHSKPGEDLPFVVHSGLVDTHGPAQLGISELVHQGRLPENPSSQEIAEARDLLMDPAANVELLAAKLSRLKGELGLDRSSILIASRSYVDAKAVATLAYLHNGKLDYPARVLRYMQDPALHGLMYSTEQSAQPLLI
nr:MULTISPECIES: helicase DnaB [unclassified Synechococcus]